MNLDSPILNKTSKMVKAIWKVYKVYEPELQKMLDELKDKKLLLTFEKRKDLNLFLNKAKVNEKI